MVFYRKYRSSTLDEMVGQTQVKQSLQSAFQNQKLAHAYLFYGPRGVGKTSAARILAKMVNCEDTKNAPCNKCKSCLTIADGSNLDLIEIDAASNRGIDDIRTLRENIKLAPTSSKKKVYIIDEVHSLTGEAFNALLKTLEEPPSHVLFILATTEVQKVPATILSRVSRIDFKAASIEELKEALSRVIKAEKLEVTEEALLLLAKKAQGSFRDAVKFLDQLSSLGKIDKKAVEEGLGIGVGEGVFLLIESIAQNNSKEAISNLTKQIDQGASAKDVNLTILDILRELLLIKNNLGEQLVKPEMGSDKYPGVVNLADKFSSEHLLSVIDNFQQSVEQGKYVPIPTLPLEVAIVESCMVSEKQEIDTQASDIKEQKEQIKSEKLDKPEESEDQIITKPSLPDSNCNLADPDLQKIFDRWTYILETIRAYNYSLEALLRSSKIKSCTKDGVLIEVPYSFHQRMLEAPKSRDILESILSDVLERNIRVSTILGQRPTNQEDVANVEVAADDEIIKLASEIFNSETAN